MLRFVGCLLLLASAACGPLAHAEKVSRNAALMCDAKRITDAAQHAADAAINLAKEDYAAASQLALSGLNIVGEDYDVGTPALDDTGQKLAAAASAEASGNLLAAANVRVSVLKSRIELYRTSYQCGSKTDGDAG